MYLDRAHTLLAPVLSIQEFHLLEQQRAALAELPAAIAREIEKANWSLVKELSERGRARFQSEGTKRFIALNPALMETQP